MNYSNQVEMKQELQKTATCVWLECVSEILQEIPKSNAVYTTPVSSHFQKETPTARFLAVLSSRLPEVDGSAADSCGRY
jgi:hypothetical protein